MGGEFVAVRATGPLQSGLFYSLTLLTAPCARLTLIPHGTLGGVGVRLGMGYLGAEERTNDVVMAGGHPRPEGLG